TIQEQRPLATSKLAADQATLDSVQRVLRAYYAEHDRWPIDKAALLALLPSPPRFQCPENDFEYDPASGSLRLAVSDPARCCPPGAARARVRRPARATPDGD